MLGPDPAVLFWTPIALLFIVLGIGFTVYYLANNQPADSK